MSLAAAWPVLTGPRVEDFWVELVDVVEVAGPPVNIITGDSADFEGGTIGGWSAGGSVPPTITSSTVRANDGLRSMLVTWASGGAFDNVNIKIPTVDGHTYTARAYVYVPTGSPRVGMVVGGYSGVYGLSSEGIVDRWARIEVTWTASSAVDGGESQVQIWPGSAPTAGQQVWVDQVFIYDHDADTGSTFTERPRGALGGVTSCRVEHNVNATIRGGCSLALRDVGESLDWASVRFRPWVRVNDKTWPLGVYLPASPSLSRDEYGSAWAVPCLDKTSILDQDVVIAAYSAPVGAVVTDLVGLLIESAGEMSSVTPSALTVRSPLTWDAGTPKLRIINDLLDSINYFALWADRRGQFRAEPYRRPQDRTLAATFAAGESSILSPSWSREQDIAGVPNQVVLIVEGDEDEPGMVATATNTDPASPYSTVSRGGRVVARVYDNVEAADQATLNALAARYLAEASTPSASLSVAHASVPLDGNDVVRFADGGVDTLAVVEGWQVDLAPGALMSGKWREVQS